MTAVSAREPESEPPERKERAGVGEARAAGVAERVLALQRTAGNRAVAAMIARDEGAVDTDIDLDSKHTESAAGLDVSGAPIGST